MSKKFYEIVAYQKNGFVSNEWSICFYRDRQKTKDKCAELNKQDNDTLYYAYERKFEDEERF